MSEANVGDREVPLEFWYDFASPYAYLAAMRIEKEVAARGKGRLRLLWRPFLLGPIFKRRVHTPSPFQHAEPAERHFRHRDVERYCQLYGLPLTWPSTYPRGSLLATRVALIATEEGWGAAFARSVYTATFAADQDIAAAHVVAGIVRSLGRNAEEILARAAEPEVKARLADQVERAVDKGIFGAPSFIVGDELFWGNDRMEQAISWALTGKIGDESGPAAWSGQSPEAPADVSSPSARSTGSVSRQPSQ